MSHGKITFLQVMPDSMEQLSPRSTEAVADADIIIWSAGATNRAILQHARDNADIVDIGPRNPYAPIPFYDLASRDGFVIAHVGPGDETQWEHMLDRIDLCSELGLETEILHRE